jgi:hypothetical protein
VAKIEVKRIQCVDDLVGQRVTVAVTDGNRVTEETTIIGVVLQVLPYGVLLRFPRRGATISEVLPWANIVRLAHRFKDAKTAGEADSSGLELVTTPTVEDAPKRRGRRPKAVQAVAPEPEAEPAQEQEEMATEEAEVKASQIAAAVEKMRAEKPQQPASNSDEEEANPVPDSEDEDEPFVRDDEDDGGDAGGSSENDDDDDDFYGLDEDFGENDDDDNDTDAADKD